MYRNVTLYNYLKKITERQIHKRLSFHKYLLFFYLSTDIIIMRYFMFQYVYIIIYSSHYLFSNKILH